MQTNLGDIERKKNAIMPLGREYLYGIDYSHNKFCQEALSCTGKCYNRIVENVTKGFYSGKVQLNSQLE